MNFITIIIYLSIYLGLVATSFYILSFLAGEKKKKLLYSDDELPYVTVIIPAYNEEETIGKTIDSIAKSDYPRFEVLVVDDGSTDDTLKIAKKFQSKSIKVFHKENGGKATALNFGIKKAKGEIIFTMDADTFAAPQSMKNMTRFFKADDVMSVTPAIVTANPRNIFERIQHTEYVLGLFLRKAFSSLRSIYVAPGAFSAYRKKFFEKHGGYEEDNITEDLEMGLRIQFKGYHTENCPEAPVYTVSPRTFGALLVQRRRWYSGLMKNLWDYRKILGRKYGDLGTFVIPVALTSIFFSLIATSYFFINALLFIKNQVLFLHSINFDVSNTIDFNLYILERFFYLFLTKPIVLFAISIILVFGFYGYYAAKKIGKIPGFAINLVLFLLLFSLLFGFWWIVSIIYTITTGKVRWR